MPSSMFVGYQTLLTGFWFGLCGGGHMPVTAIITIWYIMALLNPMQALLNAMMYRRWSTSERPFRPSLPSFQKIFQSHDEQSPLLGTEPPRLLAPIPAINNYATL